MIARAMTLAAGLAGGAGMSQFPEYSQQYLQRLGGAVDELTRTVQEFDADATSLGLSREVALQDLASGGQFAVARATTMQNTIERHAQLSADLAALEGAGPFSRVRLIPHLTDPDIASRAWQAYKPAVPATFEGMIFAGTGFATGLVIVWLLFRLLRMMWRRPKTAATSADNSMT